MAETALVPYSIPDDIIEVDTDFITSDDLVELEQGIKGIGRAADVLALAQGVAIVKIESEGLWLQAGFPNLRSYRIAQTERLDMPHGTITLRRRTAETWLKYRKQLSKVSLTGKVSSLAHFEEGVGRHGFKETLEAFKKMNYREFQAWAAPRELEDDSLVPVEMSIRKRDLVIDGMTIATFAEGIPEAEKEFLASFLRDGYTARKGNYLPHVVPVYDKGEARAVDTFLKKFRAQK